MNELIKIIAIALCTVLCAVLVKEKNPSAAIAVSVSGCIIIIVSLIPMLSSIQKKISDYSSLLPVSGDVLSPMIKVTVIAVSTRIAAEICRDNGNGAISAKLEFAGTVAGLICAMPLLDKALEVIGAI